MAVQFRGTKESLLPKEMIVLDTQHVLFLDEQKNGHTHTHTLSELPARIVSLKFQTRISQHCSR